MAPVANAETAPRPQASRFDPDWFRQLAEQLHSLPQIMQAVAALSATRHVAQSAYVAPRTATEQTLAAIWVDLLKLDQVGVHDNFFSLGGHSLLATQLMSKIRAAFEIELPLRTIFEMNTIADLATNIEYSIWLLHSSKIGQNPIGMETLQLEEI